VLWEYCGKVLVRLSADVVVKVGTQLDIDEVATMDYVRHHTLDVPISQLLGIISIDATTYIFMTYLQGTLLDQLWPILTNTDKSSIQSQPNSITRALRQIPYGDTTHLKTDYALGGGVPPRCKDARRQKRSSRSAIYSEAEFNDFILSNPHPGYSKSYLNWLRSMLRDDHRIVMSHGDLRPGNILVIGCDTGNADSPRSEGPNIRITGIAD